MATFANLSHFEDHSSRLMATGTDLRASKAIVDPKGAVLAYAKTGGMISPERFELGEGEIIYRFGSADAEPSRIAKGGWWIQRTQFEKLFAFAQVHDLNIGMAARLLCLVPPEWSDLGTLIRARLRRPLLAWRGLGDSVVVKKTDGLGPVKLPHQNEIAARRVYQLFIPGLAELGDRALQVTQDWKIDKAAAKQGWLYL